MDDETTGKVINAAMATIPEGATELQRAAIYRTALNDANRVVRQWAAHRQARQVEDDRHRRALEEIAAAERKTQGGCPHTAITTHCGLDTCTWTMCNLCGAQLG